MEGRSHRASLSRRRTGDRHRHFHLYEIPQSLVHLVSGAEPALEQQARVSNALPPDRNADRAVRSHPFRVDGGKAAALGAAPAGCRDLRLGHRHGFRLRADVSSRCVWGVQRERAGGHDRGQEYRELRVLRRGVPALCESGIWMVSFSFFCEILLPGSVLKCCQGHYDCGVRLPRGVAGSDVRIQIRAGVAK